jgi:hypothetical protein
MHFARPCGIEDSDTCYLRNVNLSCLVLDLKLTRVARRLHFALPFQEETPFSRLHRYRAQMIYDKLGDDGTVGSRSCGSGSPLDAASA